MSRRTNLAAPWRDVAIVGVYNTRQARTLPGETAHSLIVEATLGALADAGLTIDDVDGISAGDLSAEIAYELSIGPAWIGNSVGYPILSLFECAATISCGLASVIVLAGGDAGTYQDRSATAPWTRPVNEFVAPFGLFTAAEFALIARAHMDRYGTTPEQLAIVSATIRNNGHVNPEAVYHGRGPFSAADVLSSRMIADPFHLLDCSMTSEGGCALVIAHVDRAKDLRQKPAFVLGAGHDSFGPPYHHPPRWDLTGRRPDEVVNGQVGGRAARMALAPAGLEPADVDVLELYDPFSFEIVRQLEAFGFCAPGEGGPFVEDGHIGAHGRLPVNTDGGLMSFSHAGHIPQHLQRIIRGVQQVTGRCASRQVEGATVALCSNGGAGALFTSVAVIGGAQP
jgi:acetyl-CoA acetyltransferase